MSTRNVYVHGERPTQPHRAPLRNASAANKCAFARHAENLCAAMWIVRAAVSLTNAG